MTKQDKGHHDLFWKYEVHEYCKIPYIFIENLNLPKPDCEIHTADKRKKQR